MVRSFPFPHSIRFELSAGFIEISISLAAKNPNECASLGLMFLKLLFPDMSPTEEQFREYCVRPAVELRQRVRDELHKMDPEYAAVQIGVG